MSYACSARYFSASLMDSTCVRSMLSELCSFNISRSSRASPGLSSTRRRTLIDFLLIFLRTNCGPGAPRRRSGSMEISFSSRTSLERGILIRARHVRLKEGSPAVHRYYRRELNLIPAPRRVKGGFGRGCPNRHCAKVSESKLCADSASRDRRATDRHSWSESLRRYQAALFDGARASDEDIHQPLGAFLPIRAGRHIGDAN